MSEQGFWCYRIQLSADDPIVFEQLEESLSALLDGLLVRVKDQFGLLRFIIRIIDSGEALDLASTCLLVKALGVPAINTM